MTKLLLVTASTLAFASAAIAADLPNSPASAPDSDRRQGSDRQGSDRQVSGRQGPGRCQGLIADRIHQRQKGRPLAGSFRIVLVAAITFASDAVVLRVRCCCLRRLHGLV